MKFWFSSSRRSSWASFLLQPPSCCMNCGLMSEKVCGFSLMSWRSHWIDEASSETNIESCCGAPEVIFFRSYSATWSGRKYMHVFPAGPGGRIRPEEDDLRCSTTTFDVRLRRGLVDPMAAPAHQGKAADFLRHQPAIHAATRWLEQERGPARPARTAEPELHLLRR